MFLFDWFRSFLPLRNPIGFGGGDFIELVVAALLVALLLSRVRVERPLRKAGRANGLVHAAAGGAADRRCGWRCCPKSRSHPQRRRRFQPSAGGGHAAPFSPGESGTSDAAFLRIGLHAAGAQLQLHLSDRPGPGDGAGLDALRPSVGGSRALGGGILGALLLDAARLDYAGLGAGGRTAGGDGIRPAALLDEHVLGRRRLGRGRMPDLRRAAAAVPDAAGRATRCCWARALGLQLLSRPFEAVLLAPCVAMFCLPDLRRMWRPLGIALLAALPAVGLMLLQNKQVTGSWTTMPYALSQYQYGVPTTFTMQPAPLPHRELTQQQRLDYDAQAAVHGTAPRPSAHTWPGWPAAYASTASSFSSPLYLALPLFLPALRESAIPLDRADAGGAGARHEFLSLLLSALHRHRHLRVGAGERHRAGMPEPLQVAPAAGLELRALILTSARRIFFSGTDAICSGRTPPLVGLRHLGFRESWRSEGRIAVNRQLAQTARQATGVRPLLAGAPV